MPSIRLSVGYLWAICGLSVGLYMPRVMICMVVTSVDVLATEQRYVLGWSQQDVLDTHGPIGQRHQDLRCECCGPDDHNDACNGYRNPPYVLT